MSDKAEQSWALGVIHRPPVPRDYDGLSHQQASRRTLALCRAAGETEVTRHVAEHLACLARNYRRVVTAAISSSETGASGRSA